MVSGYAKFLRLIMVMAATFAGLGSVSGKIVRGRIRIEGVEESLPHIRIFFNGSHTTSNSEGFFSLPLDDDESFNDVSLLITSNIEQRFDKHNTLKSITAHPKKQAFFKHIGLRAGLSSYPQTLLSKPYIIPKHCVVIILDPIAYLERIDSWRVNAAVGDIVLPAVVVKKSFVTDRQSEKCLLKTLDATTFHYPVSSGCKRSLPTHPHVDVIAVQ